MDIDSASTEESQIRITAMLGVLADKAERQKRKIAKILSKPKHERNIAHLKVVLHENKAIRKLLKKVQKECFSVVCPHCNHNFIVETPKKESNRV